MQSYLAFAIRQGGLTHDQIKSLAVIDVRGGVINEVFQYNTNPENLSDVWLDLRAVFDHHQYGVAYNLSIHRSNLEKSLLAVGITPPPLKYVCAFHWAEAVKGSSPLDVFYGGSVETLVGMVQGIEQLTGQTVKDRYNFVHRERVKGVNNFFRSTIGDAVLDGLEWVTETPYPSQFWKGKTIVITGQFFLYPDRNELADFLAQQGAKIVSAISSKTEVVVLGTGAGPAKLDKVRTLMAKGQKIVCVDENSLSQVFLT